MSLLIRLPFIPCCTFIIATQLQAATAQPFSIKNLNPFIQIYGMPVTENAALVPARSYAGAVALDMANNSILTTAGKESVILDGETYRLAFTLRYGLDERTEVGLEIPFIAHSNGFMDNFIEDWHDSFGLSNAERVKTTSNTLRYRYAVANTALVDLDSPSEGIGDIRLYSARQLSKTADSALSLHLGLKLPTGRARQLHGSGATDVSVSLAHIKRDWLTALGLTSFTNAGIVWLGEGEVLPDTQENVAGFASAGLIWDNSRMIDLKAQLDMHTRIYDSELDQLGAHTVQLTVGGSVYLGAQTRLDIGVGENLLTDTTPDFLINLVLKHGYR
ncbi:hypothetical protein Tel_10545 [Candidatus Tenderia electrophaga]|jgi:hypothetical protein|uniref:DUF3187 family protein n=1 Tax=Candidatus Tenderia electrophaga TaxID=1748243 RepID=A0A0S2TEL6_9GAMM|nr:hypothetical protein Tel_10545 [Candidatus Tenderia electrophaga]